MRQISAAGLALVKSFESCRLVAYQDEAGVWTIGWGHVGPEVVEGLVWTQGQADGVLMMDLAVAEGAVERLVKIGLTAGQFDALVDFVYNEGEGHFAESTLLRCLNAGDLDSAMAQFKRWDIVAGEVDGGLLRRRTAELVLFNDRVTQ